MRFRFRRQRSEEVVPQGVVEEAAPVLASQETTDPSPVVQDEAVESLETKEETLTAPTSVVEEKEEPALEEPVEEAVSQKKKKKKN